MGRISAKDAVRAATSYLSDMSEFLDSQMKDIRLEEIELLEEQKLWAVTLGYDVPSQASNALSMLIPSTASLDMAYQREYKMFQVNSETGEVQSMKIRLFS